MEKTTLLLEPFCVDSHKLLVNFLEEKFRTITFTLPAQKWHWKARTAALYLAQIIPSNTELQCRTLFASSVLNLAELVALRPDLAGLKKILYFHENQLVYPVRKQQDRDFQYGYNQIISSLVADVVIFNSVYNMSSFLSSISSFLNLIPDHKPQNVSEQIRPKCQVLYLPLQLINRADEDVSLSVDIRVKDVSKADLEERKETSSSAKVDHSFKDDKILENMLSSHKNTVKKKPKDVLHATKPSCSSFNDALNVNEKEISSNCSQDTSESTSQVLRKFEEEMDQHCSLNPLQNIGVSSMQSTDLLTSSIKRMKPLCIVWPHRWEHDKNPEMFFSVLFQLQEEGYDFRVSVLGGQFTKVPAIFGEAKDLLASKILHWGYLPSKDHYYSVLKEECDVVVSTADHEFLGLAMLEASFLSCYPLCPNRLAYPEIFPKSCLYNTRQQLFKRLREFCKKPWLAKETFPNIDFGRFNPERLLPQYEAILKP